MVITEPIESGPVPSDAASFGDYVRSNDSLLRGVAWAVVRDQHRTDDVMQAAYEKAYRSLAGFDGRSAFDTWMYSIIYRTAIDHSRYEGRRRHEDVTSLDDRRTATDDAAAAGIGRAELKSLVEQLSPDERVVMMLIAGCGHSYAEVAEIVGEPKGTVAARVSRARNKLERWQS